MGRKKTSPSYDSLSTDKLQSAEEDMSTTEEFEVDSDAVEETTVTKIEEVEIRTSGDEDIEGRKEVLPVKRGRGRPSKTPKKRAADPTNHDENVVKRKRGRPKKYPGISNGTEQVPKSSKKSVPSVYLDTFDEEGYPQKRRGRPRKQPMVVINTDDNTEVDYLEWYADDGKNCEESVVKKKRGRPKKFDSADGTKKQSKPGRKSGKKSLPRILLKDYTEEDYPRKGRGRPRKDAQSTGSSKNSKNESRLGSEVDRLSTLMDRLENRINLDGLIDEDTDIESEQEIDKQIFLLQRNFDVNLDLKDDFKLIVRSYLEDLGAVQGCLIATVRSYKNSGRIVLFEIWESESEQAEFFNESVSRIFDKETSEMLKNDADVKNMNIPARWWQRTR